MIWWTARLSKKFNNHCKGVKHHRWQAKSNKWKLEKGKIWIHLYWDPPQWSAKILNCCWTYWLKELRLKPFKMSGQYPVPGQKISKSVDDMVDHHMISSYVKPRILLNLTGVNLPDQYNQINRIRRGCDTKSAYRMIGCLWFFISIHGE